jgi:xylulokinase
MLPHFNGRFQSRDGKPDGARRFQWVHLHGKGHFVRSILEGVAFNLRQILEALNQVGYHFDEVRTSGGGARSPLWNQIKADICGIPIVTLANEETALLGNAILAGVAIGVFNSVAEACDQMVAIKERIKPGNQSAAYEKPFQRYNELNQCLGPYFRSNYSG